MRKSNIISNLSKVKLVIGNGFDLYCGFKTKYSDFFNSRKKQYEEIITWADAFTKIDFFLSKEDSDEYWNDLKYFDELTSWDLLFCFCSYNKKDEMPNWDWCNIEEIMLESLQGNNPNVPFWHNVYLTLGKEIDNSINSLQVKCLAAFLKQCTNGDKFLNENEFYSYLLNELYFFEEGFAHFISKAAITSYSEENNQTTFENMAKRTIKKLCSLENISCIDTFNYDEPKISSLENKFNHINGDLNNPIFGVDSNSFSPSDTRYLFTKTCRRMEWNMIKNSENNLPDFDNIIIFGHSLDEADYSYFFSIFDKLNIADVSCKSKIVFGYTIYDEDLEDEILVSTRVGIARLFQEYAKYKFPSIQPTRLLDQLTMQGKIIIFDIGKLVRVPLRHKSPSPQIIKTESTHDL